ncbi:MAG: ATPase domain-containing protein [Euryarchaeota archaeon]|nr:ATPase domain-containing protein [Euryarchaeota archaeon]
MERVSTGIEELDRKLSGGYPENKVTLITGVAGSGKTIYGIHFLHRNCVEGRKCLMIATEETPEDILYQAELLGHDIKPYYESGQLTIENIFKSRSEIIGQTRYGFKPESFDIEIPNLIEFIRDGTECLVIDNLGTLALRVPIKKLRDQFDGLNYLVRKKGCTTLLIMDESAHNLTNQIAEYSVYGSIRLLVKENAYLGKMERYLYIPKMRSTPISLDMSIFEITSEGIKIRDAEGENLVE